MPLGVVDQNKTGIVLPNADFSFDKYYPNGDKPVVQSLTDPTRQFTLNRGFNGPLGVQTSTQSIGQRTGFDGTDGRTTFSDEQLYQGSTSGRMEIRSTDTGGAFGLWGGQWNLPYMLQLGDEIFLRYRMFFPLSFDPYTVGDGNQVKFLRLHTRKQIGDPDPEPNQGYLDIYFEDSGTGFTYDVTLEGTDRRTNFAPSATYPFPLGFWQTYNVHYILHNDPAQALGRIWLDNDLVFNSPVDDPLFKTLNLATDLMDWIYFFTYWNGILKNNVCYIADAVITSIRPASTDANGYHWIGV